MKPRKPKWIAAISHSKRASRDAYNREANLVVGLATILYRRCPVAEAVLDGPRLVECVHHLRGKGSEALRHDKRGWLLVSLHGHQWIDRHRAEARERGWLCEVGKFGTPFKPGDPAYPGSVADNETR